MRGSHGIRPGAEPYRHDGGPVGALLLHGFTGSPASLRPLGEFLGARGLSVSLPRLPGHGTHPDDLARTTAEQWVVEAEAALSELWGRCSQVGVVGLSTGGSIALHLAATNRRIGAVALVNPYVVDRRLLAAPALRLLARSRRGVINDIKRAGQDEVGYDRIPVPALSQLRRVLKLARRALPRVMAPLLVFRSNDDHVVGPASLRLIMAAAPSAEKEVVALLNSYHVATLDFDAEVIQERVFAFITARTDGSPAAPPPGPPAGGA